MATISVALARQYAAQAGFSGQSLNIIVAIAQAESGLNTTARHNNSDGSIDYGILQINDRAHPDVSPACANDPACAFQQGWKISNGGTNFHPWTTYNNGAYLKYMQGGSSAGGTLWYNEPVTHGYITSYQGPGTDTPHYAEDLGAPQDTPFFFLEPGTIKKADYQAWGGEVFLQPDSGGPQEYVFHLDEIDTGVGQHVDAGQIVGLSGGQTSGGSHPTSPQYSTGPHIHFGEFTNYTTPPQTGETIPYGPSPQSLIDKAKAAGLQLIGGGSSSSGPQGSGGQTVDAPAPLAVSINNILSEFPGFTGIAIALDKAESFPGIIWHNPGDTITPSPPAWTYLVPGALAVWQAQNAVFSSENYIGAAIRSVLDTVVSNMIPFFFRSILVACGFVLVGGLLWNAANASGLPQTISGLAKAGAVAA